MAEHGGGLLYNRGCRCDACRLAANERSRAYSQKRRDEALWDAVRESPVAMQAMRDYFDALPSLDDPHAVLDGMRRVARRALGRVRPERSWRHGTLSGYSTYGCRCDECRDVYLPWKRKRARERYQTRKLDKN